MFKDTVFEKIHGDRRLVELNKGFVNGNPQALLNHRRDIEAHNKWLY